MFGRRVSIPGIEGCKPDLLSSSGPGSHEVSGRRVANDDIGAYLLF